MDDCFSMRELLLSALRYEDRTFIILQDHSPISFSEFIDCVLRVCAGMARIPGRHLLLELSDEYQYAIAFCAGILSGHVSCLFHENAFALEAFGNLADCAVIHQDILSSMLNCEAVPWSDVPLSDGNHLSLIALSSGTTGGVPKLVGLSERNILYSAREGMKSFGHSAGDICIHVLPYWHLFGLNTELLVPLMIGSTVVLPSTPLGFFSAFRTYVPNCLHLTPSLASQLVRFIESEPDIFSLPMKIMCAGAPLNDATRSVLEKKGFRVSIAYGLTECSPCVSMTPKGAFVPHASGKPLPGCRVTIAPDGEICVEGPNVMLGYVDSAGHLIPHNGILHTGDLGKMTEDGYLQILGRKSNLLVFQNGIKVVPEVVESRINLINGVQECLLSVLELSDEEIPYLTIVTDRAEVPFKEVRQIMESFGMPVFRYKLRQTLLSRNEMGKVIRK